MTFKEFNLSMTRHPVLGKLLPLECRRTYPRLELEGANLCASFAGFHIKPIQGGIEVQEPSYYLKITYPQCSVRAFVRFPGNTNRGHLMAPRSADIIQRLMISCDRVLACYDEGADDLDQVIADYNALLETVLEPEQSAILDKMARL